MIEVRDNGTTQLIIRGDSPIQDLAIRTILHAAKKGSLPTITEGDQESLVLTLEQKG